MSYIDQCKRAGAIREPSFAKQTGNDKTPYVLVSDARPWRAAQQLMYSDIPVFVLPDEFDDYTPVETNKGIDPLTRAELISETLQSTGKSQKDFALENNLNHTSLSHQLRLLKLIFPLQEKLRSGDISLGVAKVVLSLNSSKSQRTFFENHYRDGMTVGEAQQKVDRMKRVVRQRDGDMQSRRIEPVSEASVEPGQGAQGDGFGEVYTDPDTIALMRQLTEHMGNQVTLTKSHVVIDYSGDFDVLNGIFERMGFKQ